MVKFNQAKQSLKMLTPFVCKKVSNGSHERRIFAVPVLLYRVNGVCLCSSYSSPGIQKKYIFYCKTFYLLYSNRLQKDFRL